MQGTIPGTEQASLFVNYGLAVANLNTLFANGCGYTTSDATGKPYAANGMVLVFGLSIVTLQIYMPFEVSASTPVMYRYYLSGQWYSWQNM